MRVAGNQHRSRKAAMHDRLHTIRVTLCCKMITHATNMLAAWRVAYNRVPASTRRRWRCGR
jgi:hypothetical protein